MLMEGTRKSEQIRNKKVDINLVYIEKEDLVVMQISAFLLMQSDFPPPSPRETIQCPSIWEARYGTSR